MIKELPIQKVREFCEIIWNHLQNEAFNSFDESVQQECTETIALLCSVLSSSKSKFMLVQYDSISEKVLTDVIHKCREEIEKDPDTLTGILAFNILSAIMKKSSVLCYLEVSRLLTEIATEDIDITYKLQQLIAFITILYEVMIENKDEISELMLKSKVQIMTVISKGLEISDLLNKLNAIKLFKIL